MGEKIERLKVRRAELARLERLEAGRAENVARIKANRCFAYEGVRKMGAIEGYDCGIFARMAGWLDGLGIEHEVVPPLKGCLMLTRGECQREFRIGPIGP
ncbi:MAG: hypothetical protein HY801_01635 [Candidatus Lindowbacteria bacterium]|nr:hypothetical protein [Candidatus Lindowbacteria bacterium]